MEIVNKLVDWVINILGDYIPVTYEQIYSVGEDTIVTNIIPSGQSGVDWAYIFAGILLCITVYSTFRIIGILVDKIGRR